MTPEELQLLRETHALAEENNQLLKKIRRANFYSSAVRVIYWGIIIGLSLGAYYFIQPYVDQITGTYQGFQDNVSTVKTATNGVGDLLKNLTQ
jgi:hypothetical protein